MPKTKSKPLNLRADDSPDDPDRWLWLTHAAFVMAVALVIARATITEILRNPLDVFPGGGPQPRGAGPTTILLLNLLCCLPAILILIRRVADRKYHLRWSWCHLLAGAVAIWAVISTLWSVDRFAAGMNASTLLCAAVLLWTMSQLVRSWNRLRLVSAACFGLLLVLVAHGLIHQFDEVPNMRDFWAKNGDEMLQQQGIEKGSFAAEQYERKIIAGEMFGFNFSPNTFAALLVMLAIVTMGISLHKFASRDHLAGAIIPIVVVALAFWIIYYTQSRTAFLTPVLAAILLAAIWKFGTWLAAHRKAVFFGALGAFALGVAAVVGHGIYHGSMPHVSLTFRWRYWVGAARVFEQGWNWLIGVGWSQFGAHYMARRLPEAAEEVRDPHNFIVRFFVELGVIGGVLALGWMVRMWWEMTRPIVPPAESAPPGRSFFPLAAIAVVAMDVNIFATIDFAQDPWYVVYELLKRLLFCGLLLLGMTAGLLTRIEPVEFDRRPAPWMLYGILVALGIFLIHNLIDFSLFETGPMLIFVMLASSVLGVRWPAEAGNRKHKRVALGTLVAACTAWIGVVIFNLIPIAEAESLANDADDAIRASRPGIAAQQLQQAFAKVPSNADYAYRSARAMMMSSAPPEQVSSMLARAIAADPWNGKYLVAVAEFELTQANPNQQKVIEMFDRAVTLNPNDISDRLRFADVLRQFGMSDRAREQYRIALELNDQLPSDEGERLRGQRLEEVQERAELDAAATQPASTPDRIP